MPLLNSFGFPATVYLTSFYAGFNRPIFLLSCSYLLWRCQDKTIAPNARLHLPTPLDLATVDGRSRVLVAIKNWVQEQSPDAEDQHSFLKQLALWLGTDLNELEQKRTLHLMTPDEIREVSESGFSVQLHTHRHRTPMNEALFRKEVIENRELIQKWTGKTARHFCYPMGDAREPFPGWLRAMGIVSGTTCVPGLTSAKDNPLLLPRMVDHSNLSELEFESWLDGTGALLRALKVLALEKG